MQPITRKDICPLLSHAKNTFSDPHNTHKYLLQACEVSLHTTRNVETERYRVSDICSAFTTPIELHRCTRGLQLWGIYRSTPKLCNLFSPFHFTVCWLQVWNDQRRHLTAQRILQLPYHFKFYLIMHLLFFIYIYRPELHDLSAFCYLQSSMLHKNRPTFAKPYNN